MRTLLLSKEVARIEALVQHGITSCRQEESECSLDGKFYEKNLTILQSGVNPMRRVGLDWVENSRWAAWSVGIKKRGQCPACSFKNE
jgi:hypothetical protein